MYNMCVCVYNIHVCIDTNSENEREVVICDLSHGKILFISSEALQILTGERGREKERKGREE